MKLISRNYHDTAISYQDDGWFNATSAAAKFGKRPNDWFALQGTKDYIEAFKRHNPEVKRTHFTKKGNFSDTGNSGITQEQGTWLHPKLAVAFARWLDADFAVWCDAQIDSLIRGKDNWHLSRHASSSSYKVAGGILKMIRGEAGKETESHYYSNEARLINWAMTNKFDSVNRELLTKDELDTLAYLQERNAVLIGRGLSYEQRKPMIKQYAMDRLLNSARLVA